MARCAIVGKVPEPSDSLTILVSTGICSLMCSFKSQVGCASSIQDAFDIWPIHLTTSSCESSTKLENCSQSNGRLSVNRDIFCLSESSRFLRMSLTLVVKNLENLVARSLGSSKAGNNKAHLDTSFASIDPKIMKLHPIEGTYPRIWKLHLILLTRDQGVHPFGYLVVIYICETGSEGWRRTK